MKHIPIEIIWYDALNTLAGGDFTKIDAITKTSAIQCLNHLHYLKQRQKI